MNNGKELIVKRLEKRWGQDWAKWVLRLVHGGMLLPLIMQSGRELSMAPKQYH